MHLCLWNTKNFCKASSWHIHHVLNHSQLIKNEKDTGLELKSGLNLFFSRKIEANCHSSSYLCFLSCSFTSDIERTFVALQFAHAMTQKSPIRLRNEETIGNYLMISICSIMSSRILPPPNTQDLAGESIERTMCY